MDRVFQLIIWSLRNAVLSQQKYSLIQSVSNGGGFFLKCLILKSSIIWSKIILPIFWGCFGWELKNPGTRTALSQSNLWAVLGHDCNFLMVSLGCPTPAGMGQMCAWSLPPPFQPTSPAPSSLWSVWDLTTVSTQVNEHTSPFFPARPAATVITDFKIRRIRIVKQLFVSPGVKSKYYSAMLGIATGIWTILGR